jgi:hypothetical protein
MPERWRADGASLDGRRMSYWEAEHLRVCWSLTSARIAWPWSLSQSRTDQLRDRDAHSSQDTEVGDYVVSGRDPDLHDRSGDEAIACLQSFAHRAEQPSGGAHAVGNVDRCLGSRANFPVDDQPALDALSRHLGVR